MIPAICILHCIAAANPHLHAMASARYHQLYGSPSLVNWATVIIDLSALAAMFTGFIVAGFAIASMRRELRRFQVLA